MHGAAPLRGQLRFSCWPKAPFKLAMGMATMVLQPQYFGAQQLFLKTYDILNPLCNMTLKTHSNLSNALYQLFSAGVPEEFLEHAIPDYLVRGTD